MKQWRCRVTASKWFISLALGCLAAGSALGQHVISAKAGMVHYVEGEVFLADKAIDPKPGEYPEIKEGEHLRTAAGRAEILLSPGVFLRLSENSEIGMLANKLTDTRIEVAAGSVMLEAGEFTSKVNAIELVVNGTAVEVRKRGLFRIDAGSPPRLRVYDGEVAVVDDGKLLTVKKGKQVLLAGVPVTEKLSEDDTDAFHRWTGRRSGYLAAANLASANYLRANGMSMTAGTWYFSPFFGMFTYIPLSGRYTNYWNYAYVSPGSAYTPSAPPRGVNPMDTWSGFGSSARGMQDMSGRSYGGGGYSSAPVYQAPATSAPAAAGGGGGGRGAAGGGSRGGGGGSR